MDTLLRDIRYAVRLLLRAPGFAVIALLTLALGIGANTAVFSVVNGVLLTLPFSQPERLVVVANTYPDSGVVPSNYPDFIEWRKQSHSFQNLAAAFSSNFTLLGHGEPRRIPVARISEGYFGMLGITPVLGRSLNAEEHKPGGPDACVISREFWQRELGGSSDVLGKSLALSGRDYTIVGVMPTVTPDIFSARDAWVALEPHPPWDQHGTNYLTIVGRLNPGATPEGALKELSSIQSAIDKQFPLNAHGIDVSSLEKTLIGEIRPLLLTLLAAVAFVLLIGCVNLANMLLARGAGRAREFAIRRSLGATRAMLIRQTLAESLLISLLGGALGVLLAYAAAGAMLPYLPSNLRPGAVALDPRILLFTLALSLASGVVFGLMPALSASHDGDNTSIKDGAQQSGEARGKRRLRSLLVGAEVALATLLVSGASITLTSLYQTLHTSPGFNPQGVATLQVSLSSVRYPDDDTRLRFFQTLLERVRAIPGVQSASATAYVPFGSGGQTGDFDYEAPGHTPSHEGTKPFADNHFVLPGYFRTMQISLLRGRDFDDRDLKKSPKVAIVNESLARKIWPGLDPIGRRIQILGDWQQVIGVVADVKPGSLLQPAQLQAYLCGQQYVANDMAVVLRAAGDPFLAVNAAKSAVYALDAQQPVSHVTLLNTLIENSLAGVRAPTVMLGIFGTLALLLASLGVYGVTAYSVSRRVREFGIRLALGAMRADILRLVVGTDLRVVVLGMAIGVLGALPLGRFLRHLLFFASDVDPFSPFVAVVILGLVAVVAMYLPARRASRVDPLVALRYE